MFSGRSSVRNETTPAINLENLLLNLQNIIGSQPYARQPSQYTPVSNLALTLKNYILYSQNKSKDQRISNTSTSLIKFSQPQSGTLSKCYVDQQIQEVKDIIANKFNAFNVLDQKVQKITDRVKVQMGNHFDKIVNSIYNQFESKLSGSSNNFNEAIKMIDTQISKQVRVNLQSYLDKQKDIQQNIEDLSYKIKQLQKLFKTKTQNSLKMQPMANQRNQMKTMSLQKDRFNGSQERFQGGRNNTMREVREYQKQNMGVAQSSLSRIQSIKQQKTFIESWVDQNCSSYRHLKFLQDYCIQANQASFVFGKAIISNQPYSYTVRLEKKGFAVGIGIADNYHRTQTSLSGIRNKIILFKDGQLVDGRKNMKVNAKLEQKQDITVFVNKLKGLIQWSIGKQVKYQHTTSSMNISYSTWVPFISMGAQNSIVYILE